ncbi:MAG: phosphotransferase [Arcanobacterium sp.]|nr:phosphotransferase [Arcanobacterium sp.]
MNNSSLHLAALVVTALGDVSIVGVRETVHENESFYISAVLDANGRNWYIKSPRSSDAGLMLEAEAALAPALIAQLQAGNLPFDVVRPAGFAPVKNGRAMVYSAPFGVAKYFGNLSLNEAHALGRGLAALHNLSPTVLNNSGMPDYSVTEIRNRIHSEIIEAIDAAEVPIILRRRWEQVVDDQSLWLFSPTLVHGDFADENVLWSEGEISCVLGFGQAHIGDPAADFAQLATNITPELLSAALESYTNALDIESDPNLVTRIVLYSELAILRWLLHGVRTGDSGIIAEATEMLENLAEEIQADPELAPGPTWEVDLDTASTAKTAVTALTAVTSITSLSATSSFSADSSDSAFSAE